MSTEVPARPHATAKAPALDRPRVLLVEDDEEQRTLFAWMLRSEGWTVEEAGTGVELLQWIGVVTSLPQRTFDVVLADVNMPDLSTIEVLSSWRYGGWSVPFVVVTGRTDRQVLDEANALGAVAVLLKPVEKEALRDALEQALIRSRRPASITSSATQP